MLFFLCNTVVFLIVIFIYTLAYNCIFFLLLIRTPKGIILHPCFYDLPSPRSLRSFISTIRRLNSGIKIWHNFFYMGAFFQLNFMCRFWEYQKFFFQFPGNPILKFMFNFWNCVGGAHMRECLILKISQCINLITTVILIYKILFSSLPENAHLLKRPRKSRKVDFWSSFPRKLVQVWYYCKWFLELYNLSYSD